MKVVTNEYVIKVTKRDGGIEAVLTFDEEEEAIKFLRDLAHDEMFKGSDDKYQIVKRSYTITEEVIR